MYCKNCGAPLVQGQIYCSNCNADNSELYSNNMNNVNGYQMNSNTSYSNNNFSNYNQNNANNFNNTYGNNMVNSFDNISNYQSYDQNNNYNNENLETESIKPAKRKQNVFLKIASILGLLVGVAMLISSIGQLFISGGIGKFNLFNLVGLIISIIFIFYADLMSNFNLGKNKVYDSKIVFIIMLVINLLAGFFVKIYFLVLIFSLIGFIKSINTYKD